MSPHTAEPKTSRLSRIFSLHKHSASSISSITTETLPPPTETPPPPTETPPLSLSASSIPYSSASASAPSTPTTSAQNTSVSNGSLARLTFIPSLQLDLGQSFETDAVIAHVEQVKKEREEMARREKEAREEKERLERAEKKKKVAEAEKRREREQRERWERELNVGRRLQALGVRRREGHMRNSLGGQRRMGY